jgi:hypothetical protein
VIHFKSGDPEMVARAKDLLAAVQGVSKARQTGPDRLSIHYDVRELSLQMLEQALQDVGFDLSSSIRCRIQRSLIAYCEDTLRESLGVTATGNDEHKLELRPKQSHDPRPYHWRNYT